MNLLTTLPKDYVSEFIENSEYDYIIIGAGISGLTFARVMSDAGFKVLVTDRRNHIGGNCYTENNYGIDVHRYGAHIFHTNNDEVMEFVNRFTTLSDYRHSVVAIGSDDKTYQLPFNLMTFNQLADQHLTANEIRSYIDYLHDSIESKPSNLEEQAKSLVGPEAYQRLIKHYTEKQWGRKCTELPASIIKRLPVRMNYDTTYFNNAKYQGIPIGGYTKMMVNMLSGIDVMLDIDISSEIFTTDKKVFVYTGAIDELFNYELGALEYRSIYFTHDEIENCTNSQGLAVINNCKPGGHTRTIEHRHFDKSCKSEHTIVSTEYSTEFIPNSNLDPAYPIGDDKNIALWTEYRKKLGALQHVIPLGRLANYEYYDMDAAIAEALSTANTFRNQ